MPRPIDPSRRFARFGVFEADLASGELRKQGQLRRLQQQPFAILAALLEKPGELVTREELRQRLWPSDVTVGFDQSLNKGVTKLRSALGDSANASRYVETLQRRGYRFIAPVAFAAAPPAIEVDAVVEPRPVLAMPTSSTSAPRVAPVTASESASSLRSPWLALRRWWRDRLGPGADHVDGPAGNAARDVLSNQRDTREHAESTPGMQGRPPFAPLVRS